MTYHEMYRKLISRVTRYICLYPALGQGPRRLTTKTLTGRHGKRPSQLPAGDPHGNLNEGIKNKTEINQGTTSNVIHSGSVLS
jgi:hypothetical protein